MDGPVQALKVWLIRHGQSVANAGLPTESHAEVALTTLGHEQAADAAARVNERPALIVTSQFLRARDSAAPVRARWPDSPVEIWPIEEFTYLSPERCRNTTVEMRRPWATAYWERADPHYSDDAGAENFAQFVQRLAAFRARLIERASASEAAANSADAFVVAVGHGQFFRACIWAEANGYSATPEAMRAWRAAEVAGPMQNGEIIEWRVSSSPSSSPELPESPRSSVSQPAQALLDEIRALAFLGGDAEILRELLVTFMGDAPRELHSFNAALGEASAGRPVVMSELLTYLHRLVPTLAILSSAALHDEAGTLYEEMRDAPVPSALQIDRASALAAHLALFLAQVDSRIAQLNAQLSR